MFDLFYVQCCVLRVAGIIFVGKQQDNALDFPPNFGMLFNEKAEVSPGLFSVLNVPLSHLRYLASSFEKSSSWIK